jgi:hypothetical protein
MGYEYQPYIKRYDSGTLAIYTPANELIGYILKDSTTGILFEGKAGTGNYLRLKANATDDYPFLKIFGNGPIAADLPTGSSFQVRNNNVTYHLLYGENTDCVIESGYANGNIFFRPEGTGKVKFGSYTVGAASDSTGYITILDNAGNTRKLMVQA